MARPHVLSGLTTREAIADALTRALISFDFNDAGLLDSAFDSEINFIHPAGEFKQRAHLHRLLAHIGPMDTTHMITNLRVDVKDGADTASLTAYTLTQNAQPGRGKDPSSPKYLIGGEYALDVVKVETEGVWKIKSGVFKVMWSQGDPSVMKPSPPA